MESAVTEKAKQIDKGINVPIMTMFERVRGSKDWFSFGALNLNRQFRHESRTHSSQLIDGKVKITLERDLMHNHNMIVPADDIYLCPFLKEGEETDITYMFHARNLPDPQGGRLIVRGIESC